MEDLNEGVLQQLRLDLERSRTGSALQMAGTPRQTACEMAYGLASQGQEAGALLMHAARARCLLLADFWTRPDAGGEPGGQPAMSCALRGFGQACRPVVEAG